MVDTAEAGNTAIKTGARLSLRNALIAVGGLCVVGVALSISHAFVQILLLSVATGVFAAITMTAGLTLWRRRILAQRRDVIAAAIAHDPTPTLLTDAAGQVHAHSAAAKTALGDVTDLMQSAGLSALFAAPRRQVGSMIEAARRDGAVCEQRVSHRGRIRVSVTAITGELFLWRLDDLSTDQAGIGPVDTAVPVIAADGAGAILSANAAMLALTGPDPATLVDVFGTIQVATGDLVTLGSPVDGCQARLVIFEGAASDVREIYAVPSQPETAQGTRMLFDTLPVPLLKASVDGVIGEANQAARDLLNHPIPAETKLSDVVAGLGRPMVDWLKEAQGGRGLSRSEFLQIKAFGGDRFVQVSLKPVSENGVTELIAVLTDATEWKTLEAQFVQSQKMQAIGQLAGGVAHDFNNLLTAIAGHCDLLLLRYDEGDPAYGDLEQINQNANRAAALVGQLLAFSRKQTLSPEVTDLRDILSDLTHLLGRLVGEPVRLSLLHGEQVPQICVDKRQLEQVIMNLVVNARDAMPEGGEILISTDSVVLDATLRRERAVIARGEYAIVRIRDEGSGIAYENLQKIFEPFYTTKKTGEGTGLGLSTAYGIVKQTGGFIFADNAADGGAVFTLYFPAYRSAPHQLEPEPPAETISHATVGSAVVLLVEDETPVRAFASRALSHRGFTVIEAATGEEALEHLDDPTLHVDVFVTDVVMPGIDGPEWVSRALVDRPETRVVFVSGYAEDALSNLDTEFQAATFLPKPFSLHELTAIVQRQLH